MIFLSHQNGRPSIHATELGESGNAASGYRQRDDERVVHDMIGKCRKILLRTHVFHHFHALCIRSGTHSNLSPRWKATDDQNGSSSGQWMSANDRTAWEPEGPVGGIEMNSIETKYIEQDELGQKWLRLNYDSGAAVTALPIAIAGDLLLEKCGEFRVASGATIPILGTIK